MAGVRPNSVDWLWMAKWHRLGGDEVASFGCDKIKAILLFCCCHLGYFGGAKQHIYRLCELALPIKLDAYHATALEG